MCDSFTETSSSAVVAWGRYSDLKPAEIDRILAQSRIAYVPWGALEWHSAHAPIGLDSVKAEGICCALAQETGGVVLPAIPLATNTIKPFKGFPHSIEISAGLITKLAEEICLQLADEGFRIIILFTGHYPPEQIDALKAGARSARTKIDTASFEVWADNDFLKGGSFKADHAGAYETSYQMYFRPGSVETANLPDRKVTLDDDGITGEDPREASEERGAKQLALLLGNAVPLVNKWIEELDDNK
ncbi:creatininase family protein [Pelagicoccus sp. SDUM812002]|uniref:creatininase family protein n=1 Tax=Pelagicoccus sp. SDUM812002 TaxID=3041266 RepID=UPI00280D0B70|nr:creatininase family protein [Pelagicoccus sp. SDUM812002]MDQ8187669.1 creatininase family protein [Pelagicoccus sp. SDUM812002]